MATAPSQRTRVRRAPARGAYDRDTIDAILDDGLIAHLAVAIDGQPYAIPTLHARVGDIVYVHGSSASRMTRTLTAGAPACLTVTLVDALVLARSAFHHSMNYRSVVVLGHARAVAEPAELLIALQAFTEKLIPGRWKEVRRPNTKELKGTRALAISLNEASAKIRSGPPNDDDNDHQLDVWAGLIPLRLTAGAPIADPKLADGITPSAVVTNWKPSARQSDCAAHAESLASSRRAGART